MSEKVLARKKYTTKEIWITFMFSHYSSNYVIIQYLSSEDVFGKRYTACRTLNELNNTKSLLLNNGFKINWDAFNLALNHIN